MKKTICVSVEKDKPYVIVTYNNGVRVDLENHDSGTYIVPREQFIEACQHREKFKDILGIDITKGWQDTLFDAIDNMRTLKPLTLEEEAKFIVDTQVARYGEEEIAKEIEILEKQNEKVMEAIDDERARKATGTGKGSKKSRGTGADKLPDEPVPASSEQSRPVDIQGADDGDLFSEKVAE